MTASAQDIAAIALLVGLCGAAVTGLVIVGRWIMRRTDAETVAWQTFPTAEDVRRAEVEAATLVMLAQTKALVDEALGMLGRSA